MKTLERLKKIACVEDAWDEGEDGYWVTLRRGWADKAFDPYNPCHTIHEWKIVDVLRRMKDIKECTCKECSWKPDFSVPYQEPAPKVL